MLVNRFGRVLFHLNDSYGHDVWLIEVVKIADMAVLHNRVMFLCYLICLRQISIGVVLAVKLYEWGNVTLDS